MPSPARRRRIRLPRLLQTRLEAALQEHLRAGAEGGPGIEFAVPRGEPALIPADSVSWRVFRNPVALAVGGITAVLLELAEPRVRSGVWDHTSFRSDPLKRMRRTGLAAMVTVYGPAGVAGRMIAGVRRIHERIHGTTPAGVAYRADDPELLRWVHATAGFGFLAAYRAFVRPLPAAECDRFYAEGQPIARLYGASDPPGSQAELQALFAGMLPCLERSGIVFEFLRIVRGVPLMPPPLGVLNPLLVRAAIDLLPWPVREVLGLGAAAGLPPGAAGLVRFAGALVERIHLDSSPAAQACVRLGLPADWLLHG